MKLLKYITISIWLTALLLPLITPVILQLQQRYVQWEMMEALEEKELITVSVSATAIHWLNKGKECLIDGNMFDVKNSKREGDQLILTGLYDEKEKQLEEQLLTHTKEQQKKQNHSHAVKLLLQIAAINKAVVFDYKLQQQPSTYTSFFKSTVYNSPFKGTTTPPPRLS
jgi:hypothetical protein